MPFRLASDGAPEILLIRRVNRNDWSIPKGRLMIFRSAHDSARIEAQEEAGAYGRVGGNALGSYLHVKEPGASGRRSEAVEVVVFPLEVDEVSATWPEMAERERQWFSPDEAASLVSSSHLRNIIIDFTTTLSVPMKLQVDPS